MNGKELWDEIVKQNIQHDHHESDLYLPVTPETARLVSQYDYHDRATTFVSQVDGKVWYDIPFAYDPFWQECQKHFKLER